MRLCTSPELRERFLARRELVACLTESGPSRPFSANFRQQQDCPVSLDLVRPHLADLRRARSGETTSSWLSHLIWSAVAVLSAVSHSIWPAMAILSVAVLGPPVTLLP